MKVSKNTIELLRTLNEAIKTILEKDLIPNNIKKTKIVKKFNNML